MVRWPWQGRGDDEAEGDNEAEGDDHDALVECAFQDGTLRVYDGRIEIERPGRSRHDDTTIELDDVLDVRYEKGLTIGYLQIEQRGVPPDSAGVLSDPVDKNTVHFGRRQRDCAQRAREAIERQR